MKKYVVIALVIAFALTAAGCATTKPEYRDGLAAFNNGNFAAAAKKMESLKDETNSMDYPLYMLDAAYSNEFAGDDRDALAYYTTGINAMEQQLTGTVSTVNTISPGEARFYRGDQYEHVFTHCFLGRVYFRLGQFNDARIEFQKANEQDISADAKTEHDVTLAHYLVGESFLRLDDENDAAVALRNVVKFRPEFPYAYLELAKISQKIGEYEEAQRYYQDYVKREKNPDKIKLEEKDESNLGILEVVIDVGDGPYRLGGPGNQKVRANYPDATEHVLVNGRSYQAYKLDEVLPHARHEAGKNVHAAKEAGLTAARRALEILAYKETGVLILTDENDNRRFDAMPGEFHVVQIPLRAGTYNAQLAAGASGRNPRGSLSGHGITIKAGQKTYLFLKDWTGYYPPATRGRQGPRVY